MKKRLFAIVSAIILGFESLAAAATDIKIKVNGEILQCNPEAEVRNERVMVPMRAIFEKLGAIVYWDEETHVISAVKDDFLMLLQVDNPKMFLYYSNGEKKEEDLSSAPIIVEDRALVPVRAVSESFGVDVNWNNVLREVDIDL